MAYAPISPRSPGMTTALNAPLDFLPVTRFPQMDERLDGLHENTLETQKERQVILAQPYRTTPLICPNPKTRPDFVNNKLPGKAKPTIYRPLDQRNVIANVNENTAIVNRQQYNNPRPLYSDQNIQEAIYVQTGVNYSPQQVPRSPQQQQQRSPMQQQRSPLQQQQQLRSPLQQQQQQRSPLQQQQQQRSPLQQQQQQRSPLQQMQQPRAPMQQQRHAPPPVNHQLQPPIHLTPDSVPDFNPHKSPTFQAILEEEGPGSLQPAPAPQRAPPQRIAHYTAPTYNLNSVGQPTDRIAQSSSFKRLMLNVMMGDV